MTLERKPDENPGTNLWDQAIEFVESLRKGDNPPSRVSIERDGASIKVTSESGGDRSETIIKEENNPSP